MKTPSMPTQIRHMTGDCSAVNSSVTKDINCAYSTAQLNRLRH